LKKTQILQYSKNLEAFEAKIILPDKNRARVEN